MKYVKKAVAVSISSLLIGSQVLCVSADTADDIAYMEQQQAQTNAELSAVYDEINDLEAQKQELLSQIDEYDAKLVTTITTIDLLDGQIKDKEDELEQTAKDLEKAEADRDHEYEAMKERIRYLYEEGGNAGWAALLLAEGIGISNILDKADYTQKLYDYDRKELDAYTDSVALVDELQQQQVSQKSALEVMKREQEEGKAYLEELLEQTKDESKDTETRISEANAVAQDYLYLIDQQNAVIAELYQRQEEERLAAEAAAAAAAAAEAQRQAEAQAAAEAAAAAQAAAAQAAAQETAYYDDASYDSGSYYEEPAQTQEYIDTSVAGTGEATAVSPSGSTGQDVVNYALQFVGNPYVWGGTSLTDGADCSGFVQSVYRDFGYNLSRTTYTQINEGVSVSYADAQPGDLINYGSHTAIYMGNGQIVHAADESTGITTSTNATYQPIVDIRRIIN